MTFKVAPQTLLLIAGLVWCVAGANILNLGIQAYSHESRMLILAVLALGSVVVFLMFHLRIFIKMVRKHTNRILGYIDRKLFLAFFDAKGYIMMAIMMGGGIALRMSGLVPEWFIAFFYTGIGSALLAAGIGFLIRFCSPTARDRLQNRA